MEKNLESILPIQVYIKNTFTILEALQYFLWSNLFSATKIFKQYQDSTYI